MAKEAKGTKKWNKKGAAGLFIPAGLFIGMGIGWIFGYHVAGMFIGLGVGFLAFAIIAFVVRE
jgi:predicted histidine transporter YuiF (NhaC family)